MTQAPVLQKPFLKWAGNKFQIIAEIRSAVSMAHAARAQDFERYVEPFMGSASVALNLPVAFSERVLGDFNPDLPNLYDHLTKQGDAFIKKCSDLFVPVNNEAERYYELREEFNSLKGQSTKAERRAALFVYLNRHCFNGLCRYNSKGGFNVPFGRYKKPYFPENEMKAFAKWGQQARTSFLTGSFEATMGTARGGAPVGEGDFVYCDPPYVPLSATASFTAYAGEGFGLDLQRKLAEEAQAAAERGAWVLVSNHDTPVTRALYDGLGRSDHLRRELVASTSEMKGFVAPANGRIMGAFNVQRFISANGSREQAPELLALFGPDISQVEEACRAFEEWKGQKKIKVSSAQGELF